MGGWTSRNQHCHLFGRHISKQPCKALGFPFTHDVEHMAFDEDIGLNCHPIIYRRTHIICDTCTNTSVQGDFHLCREVGQDKPVARLVEGLRSQTNLLHLPVNPGLKQTSEILSFVRQGLDSRTVAAARRWSIVETI